MRFARPHQFGQHLGPPITGIAEADAIWTSGLSSRTADDDNRVRPFDVVFVVSEDHVAPSAVGRQVVSEVFLSGPSR